MPANEKRIAQRMGSSLKRLRQARGWSQQTLAEKAEVSTDYVGLLERGERLPALGVLVSLADLFGVPVDDLLGRSPTADDWARQAAALLTSVPPRARPLVLAMLRAAVQE